MAFSLILLWTRSVACPTWTDGVYSDSPVDQVSHFFYLKRWHYSASYPTWTDGVYSDSPVYQVSGLSYLDRWRLLWFSCGPGQLPVLPGQMAFTLILLWTRSATCLTWTDGVYSDPPVDQISCLSYLDRWRLLWSSCGPGRLPSFWSSPVQQLWSFHRQT